ncbi:MAG: hypothetical protein CMN76_07465 [Spirochaetaceae bacterium]|nr:hypothetical protein [Spirochaetaceae bacterium]|tara:strand:+ start:240 stop:515 length:276 start_codon:yes stop_codon:yes gene_type:complete
MDKPARVGGHRTTIADQAPKASEFALYLINDHNPPQGANGESKPQTTAGLISPTSEASARAGGPGGAASTDHAREGVLGGREYGASREAAA